MNEDDLRSWIGREEIRSDVATAAPISGFAAALDHETPCELGDEVPPLWHWGYFLPSAPTAQLGADGHPKKGGFLPPVDLPRRMWAGSRMQFLRPLKVGDVLSRRSTVSNITAKEGRSGPLYFVKVRHEITAAGALAIVEDQDVVYRQPPSEAEAAAAPTAADTDAVWKRRIEPSPVLLFRYSALTFNSHRIHFDRPYAEQEEGYRGLVVHGPLIATLLLDLLRRQQPGARVREFSFRAMRPLLDTAPFWVCGAPEADGRVRLWAQDESGALATSAIVQVD
jgi:3-methylfumaryl-CoA hydratase